MAIIVGITGGIGSGKSIVCRVFELLGVPVFEADSEAKKLLDTDTLVRSEVKKEFGSTVYNSNGTVNRQKLAKIIFNDKLQLEKLNNIVHPAVHKAFNNWLDKKKHSPYVIHEAAILFESGFYKFVDYTILITAPREERIQRVIKRDGNSRKSVEERMKNQFPEKRKSKMADIVLMNDNTTLLIPEILKTDKNLRKYGKIW